MSFLSGAVGVCRQLVLLTVMCARLGLRVTDWELLESMLEAGASGAPRDADEMPARSLAAPCVLERVPAQLREALTPGFQMRHAQACHTARSCPRVATSWASEPPARASR